jgi:acetylglutamate kinase
MRLTSSSLERCSEGSINKQIVTAIQTAGGQAIGLSGKDARLIEATKLTRTRRDPESAIEQVLDLGFVGQPSRIRTKVLDTLQGTEIVPVIAPIGVGADGATYNINADTAAGAIAAALRARKLIMLTDVEGVLDGDGRLISALSATEARRLLGDGTVHGGMIPKLETCLAALEGGVGAAHILDGRLPHVVLLETFTEAGVGTKIDGA